MVVVLVVLMVVVVVVVGRHRRAQVVAGWCGAVVGQKLHLFLRVLRENKRDTCIFIKYIFPGV